MLHIIAAIILFLAVSCSFMALRFVMEFSLRDSMNKYPAWVIAAGVLWAAFYLVG